LTWTARDVKYRELIRRIRQVANKGDSSLRFVREGSNHELWEIDGERLVIPRHREINERTAKSIIRRAEEIARHVEAEE